VGKRFQMLTVLAIINRAHIFKSYNETRLFLLTVIYENTVSIVPLLIVDTVPIRSNACAHTLWHAVYQVKRMAW
jgi:hypothetical protein